MDIHGLESNFLRGIERTQAVLAPLTKGIGKGNIGRLLVSFPLPITQSVVP